MVLTPRFFIAAVLCGLLLVPAEVFGQNGVQARRPPELSAQLHRAETAFRSGASMLEAKARVDRVLEVMPSDPEARKLRAQVLLNLNRPNDAYLDVQEAVRVDPDDAEAYLILCEAARLSGLEAEATDALEEAAELVFDSAPLHVQLSWNAVQLGQYAKAEAFARTAIALDSRDPAGYYQLARVFVVQKDTIAAEATLAQGFQRALLDPSVLLSDTTLSPLAQRPLLAPYLRR